MIEIKIGKNEMDQRLDRYLMKLLVNANRTNVYRLIRKKLVKVNGKREKEQYFLKENDVISLYIQEATYDELTKVDKEEVARNFDLDIVYEDEDILVVNKPSGLLTHPDKTEYKKTLSSFVNVYLREYADRTFKPASIQRLDKNTSGLVIFAKNYTALKKYNELMRERKIEKYYLAVVHGKIEKGGEINGYIIKDPVKNKVTFMKKADDNTKYVHTAYKPLKSTGQYTLVEIQLHTGRAHQIRASLEYIGHPIVGDLKYGGNKVRGINNQMLHAYKVVVEGKTIEQWSDDITMFVDKEF